MLEKIGKLKSIVICFLLGIIALAEVKYISWDSAFIIVFVVTAFRFVFYIVKAVKENNKLGITYHSVGLIIILILLIKQLFY